MFLSNVALIKKGLRLYACRLARRVALSNVALIKKGLRRLARGLSGFRLSNVALIKKGLRRCDTLALF